MPENKITKQSIKEGFDEMINNGWRPHDDFYRKQYKESLSEIQSFYDSKIQELLGQIVPDKKEMHCRMNKLEMKNGCTTCEQINIYNEAIAEIKEKIRAAGYEIK